LLAVLVPKSLDHSMAGPERCDGMQVAASRAAQTLPDFTPQAIANIMWAFAILAHNPGSQLLDAVSKDVYRRLDDFSPQHIAVTLWAFGKLEASPGAVLLQVSVTSFISPSTS